MQSSNDQVYSLSCAASASSSSPPPTSKALASTLHQHSAEFFKALGNRLTQWSGSKRSPSRKNWTRPWGNTFRFQSRARSQGRENYVDPSIPKDKINWVINLKHSIVCKPIYSLRSPQIFRLKYMWARDFIK